MIKYGRFVGTQTTELSLPLFNDGALHLLISKSTLSGHVHGLKLNRWNEMANKFETIKEWP